jgi:hypothetical protein
LLGSQVGSWFSTPLNILIIIIHSNSVSVMLREKIKLKNYTNFCDMAKIFIKIFFRGEGHEGER